MGVCGKFFIIGSLLLAVSCSTYRRHVPRLPYPFDLVNTGRPGGRIIVPVNQSITALGIQVELPGMRPRAIALSPDGRLLATSGTTSELVLVNPGSGEVVQRIEFPSKDDVRAEAGDVDGQLSYTGLIFSPDGKRIYLSNVNGRIEVFVRENGVFAGSHFFRLLQTDRPGTRSADIPAGLAVSADGEKLYVAAHLSNRLLEMDAESGEVRRTFEVGVAPFEVVLMGNKAYVSNWCGRRREAPSAGAIQGSMTVIDLQGGGTLSEIKVGAQSSAAALSPNGRYLAVANVGNDTVSVIDTRKDRVIETISVRWAEEDPPGAIPNSLAFDENGKTLFVSNGGQNAIAVIRFKGGRSRLRGLIPTGWFPGAIAYDREREKIHVANIKGFGSGRRLAYTEQARFNSLEHFGSLSLIEVPTKKGLRRATEVTLENMRHSSMKDAFLAPRPDERPRPVPERAGEPSVFRHVVYVIKGHHTYDQVLGDLEIGNGNAELCVLEEEVTPNQRKIAREFVLLDNTYSSGIGLLDGYHWATAAFGGDYVERSMALWLGDISEMTNAGNVCGLGFPPGGFFWDKAREHGKTVRRYGWKTDASDCSPAEQFLKELRDAEVNGGFPSLTFIYLPGNHIEWPIGEAEIVEDDIAFGRIVEAISSSGFWKDTCIFVIENDPHSGWDHVNSYRTTAFVVSPYTRRGEVVSNNYNHTSIVRTIELILGLPPMNQFDASASPMTACFTDSPDFTPFTVAHQQAPIQEEPLLETKGEDDR